MRLLYEAFAAQFIGDAAREPRDEGVDVPWSGLVATGHFFKYSNRKEQYKEYKEGYH